MSRVRVQMRRTGVRVQQVLSPSPGFCVSSPNPSPDKTIKLNDVFDVTAKTFVVTTGKSQKSDQKF